MIINVGLLGKIRSQTLPLPDEYIVEIRRSDGYQPTEMEALTVLKFHIECVEQMRLGDLDDK